MKVKVVQVVPVLLSGVTCSQIKLRRVIFAKKLPTLLAQNYVCDCAIRQKGIQLRYVSGSKEDGKQIFSIYLENRVHKTGVSNVSETASTT